MKGFLTEFRDFINRGNVMDMAVGIIIGGAFTAIVSSLTGDIIEPLIAFLAGGSGDAVSGLVVPGTDIDFGKFISACINFLIIALVVFFLIKAITKAQEIGSAAANKLSGAGEQEAEEEKAPATCPYCKTEVADGAVRCPHCTSVIDPAGFEAQEASIRA